MVYPARFGTAVLNDVDLESYNRLFRAAGTSHSRLALCNRNSSLGVRLWLVGWDAPAEFREALPERCSTRPAARSRAIYSAPRLNDQPSRLSSSVEL